MFNNTEIAFRSKSNTELRKAYFLFKLMSSPKLTKIGGSIASLAFKLCLPIDGLIKKTLFNQFCGGENIHKSATKIKELASYNIKTILDYSVEGKASEADFVETTNEILSTIEFASNNKNIPFAVFKITGIARFQLLEKLNNGGSLSTSEQQEYNRALDRIKKICEKAHKVKVPIMIDAEESWIQNTIDAIAENMMLTYNKDEAIVFNTLQMYRHDRLEYFKKIHLNSKKDSYFIGIKLVRGAYMEKENKRAFKRDEVSPIQPSKDACDKDYNAALKYACENLNNISICAGTHNEKSSDYLIQLMRENNIAKNNPQVYFSQLLGMSDHISFILADKGYNTVKYVPYGPVKDVLPYLIRRAEENRSIAGQTGRELNLISQEIKRRKKSK